jgi:hypothetical protein
MPQDSLEPLYSPLTAVQSLLERFDNQGIIIGGVAASLLGPPRLTADVDVVLLLSTADIPRLIKVAQQLGLEPRPSDAERFARQNRVLLLRHTASAINVDVSLGMLPFEVEAVERAVIHEVGSLKLRLPTPEDLIILKAVAHRPKDLLDIQALIGAHPKLDRRRIQDWVQQFAEALDMPELWADISGWLRD